MSDEEQTEEFFFELGDIIKINAPENKDMDQSEYIINYLDENRMSLIDIDTLDEIILNLLDGQFTDDNIVGVEIISRPKEEGFARQNGLTTGVWVSIQIGGDVPITLNGQITNLENDMIELTTYGDNKKVFIDFGYKGIPLDIPIENIKPFEPPKEKVDIPDLDLGPVADVTDETSVEEEDELELGPPVADVSIQLKKVLLDADSVVFGEELEEITEYRRVKKEEERYGIETQTNDMLDDLLSTIPTNQRTPYVLNKIHTMIERFKQLREMFSQVTDDGIDKPIIKTAQYKPLVERLQKLNKKLYWILPIVKNKKKLYDINHDIDDDVDIDFIPTTLAETQTEITTLTNEFKNNMIPDGQNKYIYLYRRLNSILRPFRLPTNKTNVITQEAVESNLLAVIDNLEDFYSTVAKNENPLRHRFLLTAYNLGLTHLESSDLQKPLSTATRQLIAHNDRMAITGFLTLPYPALMYSHINLPNTSVLMKAQLNQLIFNYFSILNRSSTITTTELLEGGDAPEYDEKDYLRHLEAIKFDQKIAYTDRENNITYKNFLEAMVPKTKVLFNLVKKFIIERNEGVSYLKIIEYLEPFLIYPDDITFKQYENMVRFMEERILNLKREFISQTADIRYYLNAKYGNLPRELNSTIFNLLDVKDSILEEAYSLSPPMSPVHVINSMIGLDNMRLFSTAVALKDIDLYQPINIENLLEESQNKSEEAIKGDTNTECKNLVLAKYYIDIDELRNDDNTSDVYFDEKFDTTRYDINDEFRESRDSMSNEAYRDFIFNHLMKNV